jgi:hypothetical protein
LFVGSDPVPAYFINGSSRHGGAVSGGGNSSSNASAASWWHHIQPIKSGSRRGTSTANRSALEHAWDHTPCQSAQEMEIVVEGGAPTSGAAKSIFSLPPGWSIFEEKKCQLALKVIGHASVFFRLSSAAALSAGVQLSAVNVPAVINAFCKCAQIGQQMAVVGNPDGNAEQNEFLLLQKKQQRSADIEWMCSPQPVFPSTPGEANGKRNATWTPAFADKAVPIIATTMVLAAGKPAVGEVLVQWAENLVCAVHTLCILQHQAGSRGDSNPDLRVSDEEWRRAVQMAANFPAHSFIRQVGRWTQDVLTKPSEAR